MKETEEDELEKKNAGFLYVLACLDTGPRSKHARAKR
jgi:hypothetical protein